MRARDAVRWALLPPAAREQLLAGMGVFERTLALEDLSNMGFRWLLPPTLGGRG